MLFTERKWHSYKNENMPSIVCDFPLTGFSEKYFAFDIMKTAC